MNKLPYNIIDCRFGRLVVIERIENTTYNKAQFKCKCDCGNYKNVAAKSLRNGRTKSCGCLLSEKSTQRVTRHGLRNNKLYTTWSMMKSRCNNQNATRYECYGGRGIKVCDEWMNDFKTFYNYVSKLPHFNEPGYTLDRINNDGNYEPGNVRWATRKEQNINRRRLKDAITKK